MSLVIDDNFSSYPTGATTFGPWIDANGGSNSGGVIVDGSGGIFPPPQPNFNYTPADGHIPPTTKSVGAIAIDVIVGPQGIGIISWSQFFLEGNPTTYIVHLTHAPAPGSANALVLTLEADFSITLRSSGGIMSSSSGGVSNSAIETGEIIQVNVWHFIQLNFSCFAIPHGASFTLGIGGTISVDGVFFVDGHIDTGIPILGSGDGNINLFGFRGGTNGLITNVTFDNNPLSNYPYPAIPPLPHGKMSAAAIEYLKLPALPDARLSGAAIEYIKYPVPKARLSAAVIEILGKVNTSQGGWKVKES